MLTSIKVIRTCKSVNLDQLQQLHTSIAQTSITITTKNGINHNVLVTLNLRFIPPLPETTGLANAGSAAENITWSGLCVNIQEIKAKLIFCSFMTLNATSHLNIRKNFAQLFQILYIRLSVLCKGKKVKAEHLLAPLREPHCRSAQVWSTAFTLQSRHTRLSPRKHSPDGSTMASGSNHLIAAYYSFIDPERMKG